MSPRIMDDLLRICTTEAPFRHIDGSVYNQKDGLAMGGPLSCTMANFYLCHVENQIMESSVTKPTLYCRYVDDIFVEVKDQEHLNELQAAFENHSKLEYTQELSINNKIHFLDVLIEIRNGMYRRTVYTKPTKMQECIHYNCEAPEGYKTGVLYTPF